MSNVSPEYQARNISEMYEYVAIQLMIRTIFAIRSKWRSVITLPSLNQRRAGIMSVSTSAKPEKIAPATKNGGKIVECQPGSAVIEKSRLTIEWTDSTSGVAIPASNMYATLWWRHCW